MIGLRRVEEWSWWAVALLSGGVGMGLTFVVLTVDSRHFTISALVGVAVVIIVVFHNPLYWYRRMAAFAVGSLVTLVTLPRLSLLVQLEPDTFARAELDDGAGGLVMAGLAVIALALIGADFYLNVFLPEERRGLRRRIRRVGAGRASLLIGRQVRWVDFTEHGDLTSETRYEHVIFVEQTSAIPVELTCSAGLHGEPRVAYVESHSEEAVHARFRAHPTAAGDPRTLRGSIELQPPAPSHHRMSLSLLSYTANAFSLSREEREAQVRYLGSGDPEYDFASKRVLEPVEELQLWVRFPSERFLEHVTVGVLDPRDRPVDDQLALRREVIRIRPFFPGTPHGQGQAIAGVCVDAPRLGHTYRLKWRLPSDDSSGIGEGTWPETRRFREAVAANRGVLETTLQGGLPELRALVAEDDLTVSITTYDASRGALIRVATTRSPYRDFALAIGEGIAGRAFKVGFPLLWSESHGSVSRFWYRRVPGHADYKALFALPVRYIPSREVAEQASTAGQVVAVVTVGSYHETGQLAWLARTAERANRLEAGVPEHQLAVSIQEWAFTLIHEAAFDALGLATVLPRDLSIAEPGVRIELEDGWDETADET